LRCSAWPETLDDFSDVHDFTEYLMNIDKGFRWISKTESYFDETERSSSCHIGHRLRNQGLKCLADLAIPSIGMQQELRSSLGQSANLPCSSEARILFVSLAIENAE